MADEPKVMRPGEERREAPRQEEAEEHDGGCPYYKAGRCAVLKKDVDDIGEEADNYDDEEEAELDEV